MRARIAGLVAVVCLALTGPAAAWAQYPDDPEYATNESWLSTIHWKISQVHQDVAYPEIAVVDSGMLAGFDEFAPLMTPDSGDCSSGSWQAATDPATIDDAGSQPHGTRVAALAAAPINGLHIVGVSPWSTLVAARVTAGADPFPVANVRCALKHLLSLAQSGPLVVNLSLQYSSADGGRTLAASISRLVGARALIVAATGNSNQVGSTSGIQYPALLPHVMAVGDRELDYRLRGPQLDVLAPGGDLWLPNHDGSWSADQTHSGTSYSTAIVSGAAALLWGDLPDVSNPQVITYLLRQTASNRGRWRSSTGFGTINVTAALRTRPPRDDEFEPNDDRGHASRGRGGRLYGIAGTTDDSWDYWRLADRSRCPSFRVVQGRGKVSLSCRMRSGRPVVGVRARRASVAYQIAY